MIQNVWRALHSLFGPNANGVLHVGTIIIDEHYPKCGGYSSEFKNNCFTEMRSGSKKGSYLGLIDGCITQL